MSSHVFLGDQSGFWVSNRRLNSLLSFAIQVANETDRSADEQKWIDQLRHFDETTWPGIDLDLDERFPSIEEKKYWARVYEDVARRIFLRQLGDHQVTFWQVSAIGDACIISRLLTHAVQQVELGWHPDSGNKQEGDDFNRQITIRV